MNEQFEIISEREVLEGMTPEQLARHSLHLGAMVTRIETAMSLTSEVLEGYGTTVEEQMGLFSQT